MSDLTKLKADVLLLELESGAESYDAVIAVIRERLRLFDEAMGQKPRGWLWSEADCRGSYSEGFTTKDPGRPSAFGNVTPLYALPPIPQAADRVPDAVLCAIWRAAITAANNICVRRSDDWNADDGPMERIDEANECAKAIRGWIEPDGVLMAELRTAIKEVSSSIRQPTKPDDGGERT